MKKYLVLFSLLLSLPVYAIDYAYEATNAYAECVRSNKQCDKAKEYIDKGISYYSTKKYNSYSELKNYCSVLYLRVTAMAWGNPEQLQRDMFELNRSCKF